MAPQRPLIWSGVLAVFALCFALRFMVGLVVDATIPVMKRADVYAGIAENLAQGNGFVAEPDGEPITWRAPLYPAFLAGLYRLFGGHNDLAVFIAQVGLDSITAVLIWRIGRRFFGEPVGVCAAVAFALNPLSAYYSLRYMTEPLFMLLCMAVVAAWVMALDHPRPLSFMAVGALAALAALVKPVAVGLAPFLACCAWYRLRRAPSLAFGAFIGLIVACPVVLSPWMVRNYHVTGHLIPSATGGGYALWLGNQTVSDGREDWEVEGAVQARLFEQRDAIFDLVENIGQRRFEAPKDLTHRSATTPVNIPASADAAFVFAAYDEITSHPLESLRLLGKKCFRFWFSIFLPQNRWAEDYVLFSQSLFLLFACWGILSAGRAGGILFSLLPPVLFLVLAHVLTFATIRYSTSVLPVMTIFSVAGLREAVRTVNDRLKWSLGPSIVRAARAVPLVISIFSYRRSR